jgi:hypothetical protein
MSSINNIEKVLSKLFQVWMKIPKNLRFDFIDELLGDSVEDDNLSYAYVINMIYSYEMDNTKNDNKVVFFQYSYDPAIKANVYKKILIIMHNLIKTTYSDKILFTNVLNGMRSINQLLNEFSEVC